MTVLVLMVLAAISSVAYNQFVGKSSTASAKASATQLRNALQARAATDDVSVAELAETLWAGTDPLAALSVKFDGTVEYEPADGATLALLKVTGPGEKHSACIDLPADAQAAPPVYNCTPGENSGQVPDDGDGDFGSGGTLPGGDPEPEPATCGIEGVVTDDCAFIVSFNGPQTVAIAGMGTPTANLVIPEEVTVDGDTFTVTEIADNAFDHRNKPDLPIITSLTLPDTVTSIGASAFRDSTITALVIPDLVTTIGDYAFYSSLLTSLTLGNSVTSIGISAFLSSQLTSLTIPTSVTTIGHFAFQSSQLTSLTIPDSVTTIGGYAFYRSLLTSLTLGNSVTSIGDWAFYSSLLTSLAIPDSVKTIGNNAFYSSLLTSLVIPDSVTTIGNSAFLNSPLTSLTIPTSVTTIGHFAFQSSQLTSLTIPDSVTTIGNYAFRYSPLTSLTIPDSVETIGTNAFYTNKLTELIIPASVSTIGTDAFGTKTWYTDPGRTQVWDRVANPGITFTLYA